MEHGEVKELESVGRKTTFELRNHELEQNLQRTEEAPEKASSKEEGPSNQELYDQGYQAAVLACEAKAQTVITQRVDAAVTRRDAELLG